jgi:hypothetical protein
MYRALLQVWFAWTSDRLSIIERHLVPGHLDLSGAKCARPGSCAYTLLDLFTKNSVQLDLTKGRCNIQMGLLFTVHRTLIVFSVKVDVLIGELVFHLLGKLSFAICKELFDTGCKSPVCHCRFCIVGVIGHYAVILLGLLTLLVYERYGGLVMSSEDQLHAAFITHDDSTGVMSLTVK